MISSTLACALTATGVIVAATAEDFPLTFRTIPAQEVIAFPGGYGTYGQLRLGKPTALRKEPKSVSAQPLYGECRERADRAGFLFRMIQQDFQCASWLAFCSR